MNNLDLIELYESAIKSLLRHKLRSGLSALGVVCGVMAIVSMLSIGEGARRRITDEINRLGTNNIYLRSEGAAGIMQSNVDEIRNASPIIRDIAIIRDVKTITHGMDDNVMVVSASANLARFLGLNLTHGRFISSMDITDRAMVCVVGSAIAVRFANLTAIDSGIRIGDYLFNVIGILKRSETGSGKTASRDFNEMIFLPPGLDGVVDIRPEIERAAYSEVIIMVDEPGHVMAAASIIRRTLEGVGYEIVIPLELLEQGKRTRRVMDLTLGGIALISLFVGGIGIMNIMLANIVERTREIGIRRAVGATRRDIVTLFLSESVILTTAGGVCGVVIGTVLLFIISHLFGLDAVITIWAILLPLFMASSTGLFFGYYPAVRAANMNPVEALGYE